MATPSPNFQSGYGFVQANAALALVPEVVPAAPTIALTASSLVVGNSTTQSWSASNVSGCTASGSWSGALPASGSQTLTPTAAGTDTYTLTCSNAGGASTPSSVTLTVTSAAPPPASHSGGGGLDVLALLSLAGIGFARILRLRPRVLI